MRFDPTESRPPLSVEIHTSIATLASDWEDLADRAGASPFERPGWIAAWCDAFRDRCVQVMTVRRGGELAAVLPLLHGRFSITSPTNAHTPVFGAVGSDQATLEELYAEVLADSRPVTLSFLDSGAPATAAFRTAADEAGFHLRVRPLLRSPFIPLEGEWSDYRRRLTSKRRSNLRRLRAKLESLGPVSVDVQSGDEDLDRFLDEFITLESAGWKGERGSAIASSADTLRFYREVARWSAARGSLRLCFLRVDGRPVAGDLSIEECGRHYLIKTGFDPDHRSLAPGVLLRYVMIERAYALGLSSYELLGNDNAWKREWAEQSHERLRVQAFPQSVGGAVAWVQTYGRAATKRAARAFGR